MGYAKDPRMVDKCNQLHYHKHEVEEKEDL
jgi:hypothetical protein